MVTPTHSAGVLRPNKRRGSVPDHGSTAPAARGLRRVSLPPRLPHPRQGQARKPLPMSSAKMMLVRRAGWDRRACTTALREHCCSSWPRGSMLATSGRVDDLQPEDKSALPGAAGEAGLRPEARATASICPRLTGERGRALPLQTRVSWAAKPLCWEQAPPTPSSSHRSRDTWKHPYGQQS